MTKRSDKIQAALERLADRFEYGHLQATTDPAGFLDTVCAELDRLRAAGQPAATETETNEPCPCICDGTCGCPCHDDEPLIDERRAALQAPKVLQQDDLDDGYCPCGRRYDEYGHDH